MHIVYIIANESSVPYFKWFAEEATNYSELKFSFVALYKKEPLMLEDMQQRNCDCYWIYFDAAKRKRGMLSTLFKLKELFKKIQPDVVHTHLFDDSLPGLLAAKWTNVPVRVITKQDTTFHYNYKPQYIRFDKMNNNHATHIHAVATRNKQFILEKENADPKKVHLIRNGFPEKILTDYNEKSIDELKNTYQLKGRFVVGTVARYIDWKNHKLIIEAAKNIIKQIPEVLFLWAGTGDEKFINSLKEQIAENSLENNITICGWIERKDMPSFYQCLDVYLHPATNEPFGFAISEALFNKIPIAATHTGSTDLIEHRRNGFILKEGEASSIEEAILFYNNNPNEKLNIGKAGYAHAQQHLTFKRFFDETIELYKNALNQA